MVLWSGRRGGFGGLEVAVWIVGVVFMTLANGLLVGLGARPSPQVCLLCFLGRARKGAERIPAYICAYLSECLPARWR